MGSPLGLAGQRCMASMFFLAGSKLDRQQQALDAARALIDLRDLRATAGATSTDGQIMVVRVLAPMVEPAMALLRQVWQAWRGHFWQLPGVTPRIWSM